tara:strand:+ start:4710 stop:5417 length:708 start_codon:yes stop_codon:yes gene_type:complete
LVERRDFIINLLSPFQKEFDIYVFDAIDHQNVSLEDLNSEGFFTYDSWKMEDSNNFWYSRDLKMGSICNLLGHYNIWKHIYDNYQFALVLEDDVKFVGRDFRESLFIASNFMKTNDCDLFYLGCWPVKGYETEEVDDIIEKVGYTYNSHAYIVTKDSAKELFSSGIKNNLITTDEYIASTYCEHPREDIRHLYSNRKLNAYRFKDDVVVQRVGHSNVIGELGGVDKSEIENSRSV